ncbi:endolytic transglycosylase MltG [bacterium]|nr:endolytic transglycosylase MltG [bacterium]
MIPDKDSAKYRSGKIKPLVVVGIAVASLVLAALIAVYVYVSGEGADPSLEGAYRYQVPPGASTWRVARDLQKAGLIDDARRFVFHVKWRGLDGELKKGTYDLPRSGSMKQFASILGEGREVEVQVTITEGMTAKLVARELVKQGVLLDSSAFVDQVHNPSYAKELGLEVRTLEGFLFPETYTFHLNEPPRKIVRVMVEMFHEKVGPKRLQALRNTELGLFRSITLASIVAGEYQLPEEAPIIAGLYYNRLDRGWRLQACPTVQYLLPEGPRRLYLKDLKIESPYNTYRNRGLPPGPINNPGLIAIDAVLNPADVPYMFMVARGDGGHVFSTTGEQHAAAKREYDRKFRNGTP